MTRGRRRRTWRWGTVLPAVLSAVAGLGVVGVVTSAPATVRSTSFTDGSPIGVLETFVVRPGGMRAIGWDFDPNAKTTALRTTVWINHEWTMGSTADLARPDIATKYPNAGANHGFDFFLPVPEGKNLVCIWAKNISTGHDYKLGCVDKVFDYGPIGELETLTTRPGHLYLKGWTFDRDDPKATIKTVVSIDGVATTLAANKYRKDIGDAHPAAGPYHGFEASLPMAQGTHNVCVKTINIGYGTNNSFGCQSITLNDSPRGALEWAVQRSGQLRVVGWAYDRDAPTTALSVAIKINGVTHNAMANAPRDDIALKYPSAGKYHGYAVSYALPEGSHQVCVTARNIGYGSNTAFPCKTAVLNLTPTATITSLTATSLGAKVKGWASDPDTTAAISVSLSVDGHYLKTIKADDAGSTHDGHNFTSSLALKSGSHAVCAVAINVLYGTHNSKTVCRSITLALRPIGKFDSLERASGATNLVATGWALDPDTMQPISVKFALDGSAYSTVVANRTRLDVASAYPGFGSAHGFATTVQANDGEHTVCATALNVGGGSNTSLGCKLIIAVHPTPPSAPRNVTAVAGYGGAAVAWTKPSSDGGAPWTKYKVTAHPSGISVIVNPMYTSTTVTGLAPSTSYYFTVTATNVAGTSSAGTSPTVKTQASPPPQTTPAPVSTSRYIRNIHGASLTDQSTLRAEGATDAYHNPSGHGYLILLDIGGQDQYDGGVVLSATTRFIGYADLVTDLRAYIDGYHSKQHSSAPVTIAVGTNNDMDVSASSGRAWANRVVDPLVSYAKKYPGITVAGANDIEPGFRASYSATKNWLSGYLAETSAPFVFNGSADGCSWTATNRGCNNGWTMSGLYYLAAGAAPIRMLNLPQIYNTVMAGQWKYISLTGIVASHPRIRFGGPLTEWTACDQTNSCGSLTGHTAWSTLWENLQSDIRLKVASLPYSTDLRVDR